MHICTVCDHKYIHKGLALYQSLCKVFPKKDFSLHWLCMDDIIYEKLASLRLPNIHIYKLSGLEDEHPELRKAKTNPPSNFGDQYSQYCWALTPWFINYLLRRGTPFIGQLLYADSDIYFYKNPQIIFDVMGNKSVGIHTHRFGGRIEDFRGDNGWYNVGVMAFNNTYPGLAISDMWKSWLLDTGNPFYKTHGTCGDQKYLELFIPLFGKDNVCVFDADMDTMKPINGPGLIYNICHQAPWCTDSCGDIPVLFYHFSHFVFTLATEQENPPSGGRGASWSDHINEKPEWQPALQPGIREQYENYFEEIKRADKLISQ